MSDVRLACESCGAPLGHSHRRACPHPGTVLSTQAVGSDGGSEGAEAPEDRSIRNQVIGYLKGRAMAIEEEAANAPQESLDGIRARIGVYRIAAHHLEEEG